jgi:hypothetical protein
VDDTDNNPREFHRANVLEYTPDGTFVKIFASGIRNCVGEAINPTTGQLWCLSARWSVSAVRRWLPVWSFRLAIRLTSMERRFTLPLLQSSSHRRRTHITVKQELFAIFILMLNSKGAATLTGGASLR